MPCSVCKNNGHNKTTCPNKNNMVIPTFAPAVYEPAAPAPVAAPEPVTAPEPVLKAKEDRFNALKPRKITELDMPRLIKNLFTKLMPNRGSKQTLSLLMMLYAADPDAFEMTDGIHTDVNGNNSHISFRLNHSHGHDTIHFNGAMRSGMFIVKSGSFRSFHETSEWFYDRPSRDYYISI